MEGTVFFLFLQLFMSTEQYTFEPTKSKMIFFDLGKIHYIHQPASSFEEAQEEMEWSQGIMLPKCEKVSPLSFTMFLDVHSDISKVPLTLKFKKLYQWYLEHNALQYFDKIACVGNAFGYTKILALKLLLRKHRDKIEFFFSEEEAKSWLGWKM